AFARLIHTDLTWDSARNGVISPETGYSIRGVFIEEREQGTLIRISLSEPLTHSAELGEHNWLTLTFPDASLSPNVGISTPPGGMVLDSRFLQRDRDVQLSFRISEDMEKYDISKATDSSDFFISLRKKRATVAVKQPETPAQAIDNVLGTPGAKHVEPFFNEDLWRIDTVVIDPGHGGKDSGAVGPNRTKEKDVVLAVAKELKRLIDERRELEGVMTRDRDVFISLYQRAGIARRANGKLFVSIHANASRSRSARGMEVFFLSAAKTEDAKNVAERENASVELEDNPSVSRKMLNEKSLLSDIEKDMATNVFLKESQDICSILLDSTIPVTRQVNRGVKQAGFYVLAGTLPVMPSILFEIGFISNPEEEKMLTRVSYQKRIAQSLYDTIIKFKVRHERGLFTRSE
ncbi:MAG: N-acetylmuramoyl-L-alanine amidase family protein, partial [Candidatus Latescibacterota bacterium]